MRGPAKKPTRVRQLEGDRGKRKKAGSKGRGRKSDPEMEGKDIRSDEDFGTGSLKPPDWLSPYAKECWTSLAPRLVRNGLLTEIDQVMFEQLCMYVGIRRDIYGFLHGIENDDDKFGPLVVEYEGHRGSVRNPNFVTLNEAAHQINVLGQRFGLSPADRAKLGQPVGAGSGKDELDEWNTMTAAERRRRLKEQNQGKKGA